MLTPHLLPALLFLILPQNVRFPERHGVLRFVPAPAGTSNTALRNDPLATPAQQVQITGMTRDAARQPADAAAEADARHAAFVPRGSRPPAPKDRKAWHRAPAPQLPPGEDAAPRKEKEDPERLVREMQRHASPDQLHRAIQQAAILPEPVGPLAAGPWTEMGCGIFSNAPNQFPRTGRATCATYAFDFRQNMTTAFVGSVGGGLWRFDWATARWLPVSATLSGSPSVGAFVVDPREPRRMLVGTGNIARYGGTGLFLSNDGGSVWLRRTLTPQPKFFAAVRADWSVAQAFMASTEQGIYRSDDFGGTWTRVWSGNTTDLVQDPVYRDYWYAGAPGIGVLESDDGGLTFHQINGNGGTGLPDPASRISLSVCNAAANYVYAILDNPNRNLGGIYRSSNYGYDWRAIDNQDNIGWGQGGHACAIAVDPRDPNVLVCGMGGFQLSTNAASNGAVNWIRLRQPGHADYTSFTFIPAQWAPSNKWLLITSDGGYCTYDYQANQFFADGNLMGLNTTQVLDSTSAFAVSPHDSEIMLAGTQDNGVVRLDLRRPGAEKVEYVTGGDGGMVGFAHHTANDCYASSGGPPFSRYWSQGAGRYNTWNWIDGALPPSNPEGLYSRTFFGLPMLFTNDGPAFRWTQALTLNSNWGLFSTLPEGFYTFDMASAHGLNVGCYAIGWSGALHVVDGTTGSFSPVVRTPPLPPRTNGPGGTVTADRASTRPDDVYFTTANSRPSGAFRSQDRGRSWTDCTGNLSWILPDASYWEMVATPGNRNILFLATSVAVLRSDNGGATWTRWMTGLPQVVDARDIEVTVRAGISVVRIATAGRGFWERPVN